MKLFKFGRVTESYDLKGNGVWLVKYCSDLEDKRNSMVVITIIYSVEEIKLIDIPERIEVELKIKKQEKEA